ncbi:hypothetical protein OUZ56_014542 [Daphnia magna]|uniref:Uncharacterized protein n=1 Tax=Daphnia magna TaxID=35525 RepID=A0ABR0AK42_9CRUS|nr:hypothetical protein OUZ56_014542 [Daphnia magna]
MASKLRKKQITAKNLWLALHYMQAIKKKRETSTSNDDDDDEGVGYPCHPSLAQTRRGKKNKKENRKREMNVKPMACQPEYVHPCNFLICHREISFFELAV